MQNVYRLPDHKVHGVSHPANELDVVAAARQLVERIAAASSQTAKPPNIFKWLSSTGLLGLSVSEEFGGPDIANAVIAETVSLLAGIDPGLAETLAGHYQVMEIIRSAKATPQSASFQLFAASGDLFNLAQDLVNVDSRPHLSAARGGVALDVKELPELRSANEWVAVPALDLEGQEVIAFVEPDRGEPLLGTMPWPTRDKATAKIFIPSSHVFPAPRESNTSVNILSNLLTAAIDLGIARSIFEGLGRDGHLEFLRGELDEASDRKNLRLFGRLAALLDGVSALIERAGQHLDMVQINHSPGLATQASISAQGASVLAGELLMDLNNLLSEGHSLRSDTVNQTAILEALKIRLLRHSITPAQEELATKHLEKAAPQNWPFAY